MPSPALGIGWEMWRRHRWGLSAVLAYALLLFGLGNLGQIDAFVRWVVEAFARAYGGGMMERDRVELTRVFATMFACPGVFAFQALLVVCTYGPEYDVEGRESCFPARMFVLPVRTRTLVGWPQLFGSAALVFLWAIFAQYLYRWCGVTVSFWPIAFWLAAFLGLFQAVLWWPLGLSWLRVFVAVPLLSLPVTVLLVLLLVPVSGPWQVALSLVLAGLIPISFALAHAGVARARRGDTPDWEWLRGYFRRLSALRWRRGRPFRSAGQAQLWFEWRRHGLNLPVMVVCVLPFVLIALLVQGGPGSTIGPVLVLVVLLPPLFAGIANSTVGEKNPWLKDYYGITPFTATRPMTDAALVAAKLKMAAVSALATWIVVILVVALAIVLTGHGGDVVGWVARLFAEHHPLKVVALALAAALGLYFLTWQRMTTNLYINLTGRKWVILCSLLVGSFGYLFLGGLGLWLLQYPEQIATLLEFLPALLAVAVLLKLLAAAWTWRALRHRELMATRALVGAAGLWLVVAAALGALLVWQMPAGAAPPALMVLGTALTVPLVRLIIAPLALAWNRHR